MFPLEESIILYAELGVHGHDEAKTFEGDIA